MSKIPTYYSPHHEKHWPTIEFLHGQMVPYFELPTRLDSIRKALLAADLIELLEPDDLITKAELAFTHDPRMVDYLERLSRDAKALIREDLSVYALEHLLVGDEYYYESVFPTRFMRSRADSDEAQNRRGFYIFDSTSPIGEGTWDAIVHSANLARAGAHAILEGAPLAYAMCRPPGHHAGRNFAGGYCYFNNAGVAANVLRSMGDVAIVDIDYHHGNGTQAIFWDDPYVMYASIHADPALDYPHYAGYADEIGGEAAEGTVFNVPLPHGTEEKAYFEALEEVLAAVVRFEPSSLIVSLGFDIYKDDPMAAFALETSSFRQIGKMFAELDMPTLYVQEGGYSVDKLGEMAVNFFTGVLEGKG